MTSTAAATGIPTLHGEGRPSFQPVAAAAVSRPAQTCWDYVLESGLLDRCSPENRDLIAAAYWEGEPGPTWGGDDGDVDDQPYALLDRNGYPVDGWLVMEGLAAA